MLFKMWLFENENNKPNKIGKYKIVYIDSKKFRKSSLKNQEFCSIAIHEDFPKYIKKNEIFIDENLSASEIKSFLIGLKDRLECLEDDSKNHENCYKHAMEKEKEKNYRLKHKSKIKKEKCCVLNDYKNKIDVFYVNGKGVRDIYKTDFSQGGHGYVYDWIPKNQIWIEKEEKEETAFILVHEYSEMVMMRDLKMEYEDAHPVSSKIEMKFRKDKHPIKQLTKIPEIVMSYLKINH
jgi:hypothetical protein